MIPQAIELLYKAHFREKAINKMELFTLMVHEFRRFSFQDFSSVIFRAQVLLDEKQRRSDNCMQESTL